METEFNWKQYVGLQELEQQKDIISFLRVKYFHIEDMHPTYINREHFEIEHFTMECFFSEDEIKDRVLFALNQFPKTNMSLDKAKKEIRNNCKRGLGNKQYKNTIFYGGESNLDWPIIVGQYQDKFSIFLVPYFDRYGYVLENLNDSNN
jgi:hypothetical protein